MSSRSASTGGSTRSTPSARCSASQAVLRRRPMPTSIPARGRTLHLVGVCVNRIGTDRSMNPEELLSGLAVLSKFRCWEVERARRERLVDRDIDTADPRAVHPNMAHEICARIDHRDVHRLADLTRLLFRGGNDLARLFES